MDITAFSEKVLQVGKLGKLPSFVLGCICWAFILLPLKVTGLLGITEIINSYRSYLGLGAILFTFYLLSFILYEYLRGYLNQQIIIKRVKKRLKNLTTDEKDALRPYVEENKRTDHFNMASGVANGLESKQILYRSSNLSDLGPYFPYNIQDYAFDYLKRNTHLLEK